MSDESTAGYAPIVEIKEGRYFIGIWYCYDATNPALKDQDWMAAIFRDAGEDVWHMRYRHKYYNSPDPFDEKDRRSTYSGTMRGKTEQEMIAIMEAAVAEICRVSGFRKDFVYCGTDDSSAIIDRLTSRPWAHMKVVERPSGEGTKATPPGAQNKKKEE